MRRPSPILTLDCCTPSVLNAETPTRQGRARQARSFGASATSPTRAAARFTTTTPTKRGRRIRAQKDITGRLRTLPAGATAAGRRRAKLSTGFLASEGLFGLGNVLEIKGSWCNLPLKPEATTVQKHNQHNTVHRKHQTYRSQERENKGSLRKAQRPRHDSMRARAFSSCARTASCKHAPQHAQDQGLVRASEGSGVCRRHSTDAHHFLLGVDVVVAAVLAVRLVGRTVRNLAQLARLRTATTRRGGQHGEN